LAVRSKIEGQSAWKEAKKGIYEVGDLARSLRVDDYSSFH
jgi:hypothetical protein